MTVTTLDGRVFESPPVRPPWLRPLVVLIVVALHAGALLFVSLAPKPPEPTGEIIVDIQPEAPPPENPAPPAEEPKPPEQSAPPPAQDAAPAPIEPPPPNPVIPPVAEQPPPPPEERPPPPPPETPPPPPAPVELAPPPPPPPKPVEVVRPKPPPLPRAEAPKPQPKPAPKPRPAAPAQSRSAAPAQAARSGSSTSAPASAAASASSLSAYIGEVSSAIRSRLFYPPAARARGAKGVVGVSFSIGPSGAVSSFAITRSSGDSDLDAAARSLMQGARFPPPPGGSAHISTSFNYVPR